MNEQAVADSDLEVVQTECLALTPGGEPVVCWWEHDGTWWSGHRVADGTVVPAKRFETEAQAEAWSYGWLAGFYPETDDERFAMVHGAVQ